LNSDYGGLSALGSKHLDNMYHGAWAWAGDTPFKSTKLVAAHFGGTRTPLVISWPQVISPDRTPRTQFHHVCDIAPTVYEAVGIKPPGMVDGFAQQPLDGVSMVYTFNNATAVERKSAQYFEVMGSRGVYKDGWFAGTLGPRIPWAPNATRMRTWDPDTDVWELYNLSADFSQAHDLAHQLPEKLAEMKSLFTVEASLNKVLPIGAGLYTMFYHPEEAPKSSLTEWNLFDGQTRIAESNAPLFRSGFSSYSTIHTEIPVNASGVLYCVGGTSGGFVVYMDAGYLFAEYAATLLYRFKVKSAAPIGPGPATIEVKLLYDAAPAPIPAAKLTLSVNGDVVGQTRVEKSCKVIFDASETFDVGMDLGSPVSRAYEERLPFEFNGNIKSLNIKYIHNSLSAADLNSMLVI